MRKEDESLCLPVRLSVEMSSSVCSTGNREQESEEGWRDTHAHAHTYTFSGSIVYL